MCYVLSFTHDDNYPGIFSHYTYSENDVLSGMGFPNKKGNFHLHVCSCKVTVLLRKLFVRISTFLIDKGGDELCKK